MQSAFGVEHGDDQVSKGLIPPIGAMASNATKGFKAGMGGWNEGKKIGRVGMAGQKVGQGAAYALKNKKPLGIGAAVGGTGIGGLALANH
jgi:hypothetical protein